MIALAELIPFPIIPVTRPDAQDGVTPPGERAFRLRQTDSDSRLDQELAKSEALLFVDAGLLIDELLRIGGREFTLSVMTLQMGARGFRLIGSEK